MISDKTLEVIKNLGNDHELSFDNQLLSKIKYSNGKVKILFGSKKTNDGSEMINEENHNTTSPNLSQCSEKK